MGDYADDFGNPPEPRAAKGGGSSFLKVCLICGCIMLLLAVLAGGFVAYSFSQMFSMDPATIATRTQEIVPCTIPPGYQGAFAMKVPFAGVSLVMIGPPGMVQNQGQPPGTAGLMIMLMTVPAGQNPDQIKTQMNQQMQQQGRGGSTQIQVESEAARTFKIRGQDVEFTEQLGVEGQVRVRQLSAVIPRTPGSSDQLVLMFKGPEQGFDQAAVEAFLASIR